MPYRQLTRLHIVTTTLLVLPFPVFAQPDALDPHAVVRYDGHKIVTIDVSDKAVFERVLGLGLEAWCCEPRRGPTHFRVSPEGLAGLVASGIAFVVEIEDVQAGIDAEAARINAGRRGVVRQPWPDGVEPWPGGLREGGRNDGEPDAGDWFSDFKNLDAIVARLDFLAALRPDIATRFTFGSTHNGRRIEGLRIANDAVNPGRCKPVMLFNSTQHAREWIAPMTTMYLAEHLVTSHGTNPQVTELVDGLEFLIVPVSNPDGYVYSWTTDRFWRKNRRNNGNGTFGVDLNRNWGHMWGISLPHSSAGSPNPSSQVYWGPGPFSEPETQALRDLALSKPGLRGHNDVHSFGQMLLHPWAWTPTASPDAAWFLETGTRMRAEILAVHGRSYTPGTWYSVLYPSAGAAVDWIYNTFRAVTYTVELRGGRFDPPPSDIRLCAEENLPAMLYHAAWVMAEFPFKADWNGDCVYDIFDFLAFQNDFAAGNPRADYNGDMVLDIFDFLDFANDFARER